LSLVPPGGGVKITTIAEGSITADGTIQTILEVAGTGSPIKIYGWIDLTPMDLGDEVIIQGYTKLKPDGNWVRHINEIFNDAQQIPAIYFIEKTVSYGLKVTLQQTKGTYRTFDYLFFKEG